MCVVMIHFGFTPIAVEEGATGDEEAGGEPALASPTLEQTNRDSSPGK